MLGWFRPAALWASRRKRSTNCSSEACRSSRSFSATRRPSSLSSARYTSAIPPEPSLRSITYRVSKVRPILVSLELMGSRLVVRRRWKDRLHELFRDRRRHGAAEAVHRVLHDHRARHLRVLGGREEDEPGVVDPVLAG